MIPFILNTIFLLISSNCFLVLRMLRNTIETNIIYLSLVSLFLILFLLANIFNLFPQGKYQDLRLKVCLHGITRLKTVLASGIISAVFQGTLLLFFDWKAVLFSVLVCFLAHFIVFWNGIICVYCTSVQLGIKERVIGAVCGWIPLLNIIALARIIFITSDEVRFETEKNILDASRAQEHICKTKYPLLLVHGVFFRDFKYLNYWGRIPGSLEKNGAAVYYGNHQSALAVADSAAELTARIKQIAAETGCEKVNIIAHSKGGLDCRYAIAFCGAAPYIASLTTVNTPHRGCEFADYLLSKLPQKMVSDVAIAYNTALKKLGDASPDFIAAVNDLTAESCKARDRKMTEAENTDGILCQSIGSKLNRATNGKFPLNFTYKLAEYFEGANDGLVAEPSFPWGESYRLVTVSGKRGVSHGDIIDLNRENIDGFDVREFYVNLVADLKNKGL